MTRLTADYMRQIAEKARLHCETNGGYEKGVQRMGDVVRAEEEMRLRNLMLQYEREVPERERTTVATLADKPGQWNAPAAWLMGIRGGARWKAGCSAVLHGPAGEGKSTGAALLAYHEARAGRSVRYECAYHGDWLQSARYRDDVDADLLILDESRRALEQGAWIQGAVKELFNLRHEKLRNTIMLFTGERQALITGFGPEVWDRFPPELRYPPVGSSQSTLSNRWKEGA